MAISEISAKIKFRVQKHEKISFKIETISRIFWIGWIHQNKNDISLKIGTFVTKMAYKIQGHLEIIFFLDFWTNFMELVICN